MKYTVKVLVLAAAFLLTAGMANASDMKLGVVDVQKILRKSDDIRAARDAMQKKFSPRRNKLLALQKSIKADMEKLNRDSAVMSVSAKSELQNKIVKERRKLQGLGQDFQQDFKLAEREALKKFYVKLEAAINIVAKAGAYDLVVQRRAASYASSRTDITDKVLKAIK